MIEEINGGFVEASKPILCPISPKKLEKDAIVDGSVMEGFPLSDKKLPFELMMNGNVVEMRLTKEAIADEIETLEQVCIQEDSAEREVDDDDSEMEGMIGKEAIEIIEPKQGEEEYTEVCYDEEDNDVVEEVGVDLIEARKNLNMKVEAEKQESDGFCSDDDGEISEEKEAIEITTKMDLVAIGLKLSESESSLVSSESHGEVGLKALLPVFESPVIEHKNVNGGEKERSLPVEIVEIIQARDEAVTEGSREEQVSYYMDVQIVPEKCKEVEWPGEANQGYLLNDPIRVTEDESALLVHPTPAENRAFELPMLKEELIFPVEEAAKDDGANEEVAESLKVNENDISMQVISGQSKGDEDDDDTKRNIREEIKQELILAEDDQGYGANEEFNKSLELNEKPKYDDDPEINIECTDEANQDHLPNGPIEVKEDENALVIHPKPHKNRGFELPTPKEELVFPEDGEHEEVAGSMEPNENREEEEDEDPEINNGKEVEEDVISPGLSANEQVAESVELDDENVFVNGDRSEDDDDADKEIKGEVISPEANELTETDEEFTESNQNEVEEHEEDDDDAEIINNKGDDPVTETNEEDEESSEDDDESIQNFHEDETAISEDGEEISEGSGGDSSTESESESETVYPAEEPKREVEGKIEEDRAVKKVKEEEEKTDLQKHVMEVKDHPTRRRLLIGTISVVSSLSCSWYLGLSSVELCLIVFFVLVLSTLATTRQVRGFEQRQRS